MDRKTAVKESRFNWEVLLLLFSMFFFAIVQIIVFNDKLTHNGTYYYEPVLGSYVIKDGTEYHGAFNSYEEAYNDMPSHDISKGYSLWGESVDNHPTKYYWSYKKPMPIVDNNVDGIYFAPSGVYFIVSTENSTKTYLYQSTGDNYTLIGESTMKGSHGYTSANVTFTEIK